MFRPPAGGGEAESGGLWSGRGTRKSSGSDTVDRAMVSSVDGERDAAGLERCRIAGQMHSTQDGVDRKRGHAPDGRARTNDEAQLAVDGRGDGGCAVCGRAPRFGISLAVKLAGPRLRLAAAARSKSKTISGDAAG